MPTCDWEIRAVVSAVSRSSPSRRCSSSATCSTAGMLSVISRQRERTVGSTSAGDGVHSIQIVRAGGSSMALSSTFVARSVMRSASSMRKIRQRPVAGVDWPASTRARTSSIR